MIKQKDIANSLSFGLTIGLCLQLLLSTLFHSFYPNGRSVAQAERSLAEEEFTRPQYSELHCVNQPTTDDISTHCNANHFRAYSLVNQMKEVKTRLYGYGSDDGLLKRIAKAKTAYAKTSNDDYQFDYKNNQAYQAVTRVAPKLKNELSETLKDRTISKQEKIELIAIYINFVVLPMRALSIITTDHNSLLEERYAWKIEQEQQRIRNDRNRFLLRIPKDLFPLTRFAYSNEVDAEFLPSDARIWIELGFDANGGSAGISVFEKPDDDNYYDMRFDLSATIKRDVATLLLISGPDSYLTSLKWLTMAMMMEQITVYDGFKYDHESSLPMFIPRSCGRLDNGLMPDLMHFRPIPPEARKRVIDNMLGSKGLLPAMNREAVAFYLAKTDPDLTKGGLNFDLPFEKFARAKILLGDEDFEYKSEVAMEDIQNYQNILAKINEEVYQALDYSKRDREMWRESHSVREGYSTYSKKSNYDEIIKGRAEKILPIFAMANESYPQAPPGMTRYVYEKIEEIRAEKRQTTHSRGPLRYNIPVEWYEVLPREALLTLKSTTLNIELPPLYGPDQWRRWGLKLLNESFVNILDSLDEGQELVNTVEQSILNVCENQPRELDHICNREGTYKRLEGLLKFTDPFADEMYFLPKIAFYEPDYQILYPRLRDLWNVLRSHNLLGITWVEDNGEVVASSTYDATPTEYDYLSGQIQDGNPWAYARLGYIAMAFDPELPAGMKNAAESAAAKLGLDKPLKPLHVHRHFNDETKVEIMEEFISEFHYNTQNMYRYSLVPEDMKAYEKMDWLNSRAIFTREEFEMAKNHLFQSASDEHDFLAKEGWTDEADYIGPFEVMNRQFDQALESQEMKKHQKLVEIWKGYPYTYIEDEEKVTNEYLEEHGFDILDGTRDPSDIIKLSFLELDSELKKPLMYKVVRDSAHQNLKKMREGLQILCDLDPSKTDELKAIYYSTMKNHQEVNKLMGKQSVPEEVLSKINQMSDADWDTLKLGGVIIGSVILGFVLTSANVGCAAVGIFTFAAGGIVCGLAVTAVSAIAFGAGVYAAATVYKETKRNHQHTEMVEKFIELGFSEEKAVKELKMGWGKFVFELALSLPFIGIAMRFANLGLKTAWRMNRLMKYTIQMSKELAEELGTAEAKNLAQIFAHSKEFVSGNIKRAVQNHEALAELGLMKSHFWETMKSVAKLNIDDAAHNGKTFVKNFFEQMQDQIAKNLTTTQIDEAFVRVFTRWFGNSVKNASNFLKRYPHAREATYLAKKVKLDKLKRKYPLSLDDIAEKTILGKLARKEFNKINILQKIYRKSWIRFKRWRLDRYMKKAEKMQELSKMLDEHVGDLASFVAKNTDLVDEVFGDLPFRLRELPYYFISQGGPSASQRGWGSVGDDWWQLGVGDHLENSLRFKPVAWFGDGVVAKRMVQSRRVLRETIAINNVTAKMGLRVENALTNAPTAWAAWKHGMLVAAKQQDELAKQAGKVVSNQLEDVTKQIAAKEMEMVNKVRIILRQEETPLYIPYWSKRAINTRLVFSHEKQDAALKLSRLSDVDLHKLLFNPTSEVQQATAKAIWSAIDMKNFFGKTPVDRLVTKDVFKVIIESPLVRTNLAHSLIDDFKNLPLAQLKTQLKTLLSDSPKLRQVAKEVKGEKWLNEILEGKVLASGRRVTPDLSQDEIMKFLKKTLDEDDLLNVQEEVSTSLLRRMMDPRTDDYWTLVDPQNYKSERMVGIFIQEALFNQATPKLMGEALENLMEQSPKLKRFVEVQKGNNFVHNLIHNEIENSRQQVDALAKLFEDMAADAEVMKEIKDLVPNWESQLKRFSRKYADMTKRQIRPLVAQNERQRRELVARLLYNPSGPFQREATEALWGTGRLQPLGIQRNLEEVTRKTLEASKDEVDTLDSFANRFSMMAQHILFKSHAELPK